MKREVLEETGLEVTEYDLYTVYTGPRMQYKYPDGNEVVFVMFIFNAKANLEGKIAQDGKTVLFTDVNRESLQLEFKNINEVEIAAVSSVQRPVVEDLKKNVTTIIRS